MNQQQQIRPSLLHLSVEEENLASIPFAVLERRVGRKVGKIELKGTKILPDGTEMTVSWQVQGNSELGLPTEQDLDIFVALGVLTFRNNFNKTVSFSGREIARMLGIQSVHGKFYQRLKVAMDRFIALRFRGIAETERQEDVKWVNVFQEASFTLDRDTGRCIGSVTWTDKLIQSMNHGVFRMLDASRYMELDGITAKHLYRFLAMAFEKTDLILIDARKLATQHLAILNPPRYFSRLMQTLEPAFEQVRRIGVLGSWHVADSRNWQIALRRHRDYVPERKALLTSDKEAGAELKRAICAKALEKAGIPERSAERYCEEASTREALYQLERAAFLHQALLDAGVSSHVATSVVRKALDEGPASENARMALDWCELALNTCREKSASGQKLRNPAGLVVRIATDPDTRAKAISRELASSSFEMFRQREKRLLDQEYAAGQRARILEYEQFRDEAAELHFQSLPEEIKVSLRREKSDWLKSQGRLDRLDRAAREREVDELIRQDLARTHVPPFEKWYLRRKAQQAVLPFERTAEA